MCHNKPDICQCNPTTIIPADEKQLKRIAKLVEPKKEWVGLTDDEIIDTANNAPFDTMVSAEDYIYVIARAIEAKLKEKNDN
jgi:hypothetical protein